MKLEAWGIPALAVATHEFLTAARAQAAALGRADLDPVLVAHPIQDQTLEQIEARAEGVLAEINARLTRGQIYGAIAFYLDHQAEIDKYLEDTKREFEGTAIPLEQANPTLWAKIQRAKAEAAQG